MRAWQDTEAKRRWAATPSPSPEEGSRAASQTGAFDMSWQDDDNRSGNLSGNPEDGRTGRFARETDSKVEMRALGNRTLGETDLRWVAVGMHSAGEGARVLPGVTGLHSNLSRLPSRDNTSGRSFGARGTDAARQLDRVRVGGQRLLGWIESSGSVGTRIFDRGAEVL